MSRGALAGSIADLKTFIGLWQQFSRWIKHARSDEPIEEKNETEFLSIKTEIAKMYPSLSVVLDAGGPRPFGTNPLDIITHAVSLEHVRALADVQVKKIETDWHAAYIYLNQALGKLEAHGTRIKGSSRPEAHAGSRSKTALRLLFYCAVIVFLTLIALWLLAKAGIFENFDLNEVTSAIKEKILTPNP